MKRSIKFTIICAVLTICMSLLLTGCKPKDLLLGKWDEPTSGISMVFDKDGKLMMGMRGTSFTMSYLKQEPNILIFKASSDGSIPDQTMTYQVDQEKLILTVDGVDTVLNRSK